MVTIQYPVKSETYFFHFEFGAPKEFRTQLLLLLFDVFIIIIIIWQYTTKCVLQPNSGLLLPSKSLEPVIQ